VNGAALRIVKDLDGDWPQDMPQTAAAAEVPPEAGDGAHRMPASPHAGARAREGSLPLLLLFWRVAREEAADFMRAGEGAGAPWEVQPPSLAGLHGQVMRRSEFFAGLPAARGAYIGAGWLCALACAGCYWAGWVLFGSPGRLVLSVLACIVLRVTGIIPPVFGI
jgi:hypothetical protein